MAIDLWAKYGGIKKKTKKITVKPPMSIEDMMEQSINKQRDMIKEGKVGDSGSWWKEGIVKPKCGIFSLIDGELHMDKSDFSSFVDDVERSFKNGDFESRFKDMERKQRAAIKKRREGKNK